MRRHILAVALLLAVAPVQAVDLKPFVRGSWQELRNAHRGEPIVVHFWGVTCAPCMAELPKWGQLQRERPGAGLVFVAADPVPIEASRLEGAIAKAGIGASEHWQFADSFQERLIYEVNQTWGGELPYTVMIGRDGHVSLVSGTTDLRTIRAWLDKQTSAAGKGKP